MSFLDLPIKVFRLRRAFPLHYSINLIVIHLFALIKRNSGIVLGILAGAAIGSLLGVLFAPEKGVETRRKLRRKAEDLRDEALDHYEHLRDEALERYENISGKVKQGAEKVVADVKESYENYKKNS